jgi:gas vesicle protein
MHNTAASSTTTAEIESDIGKTRHHMDDVLEELSERLAPRQLVNDVLDFVGGAAQSPEALAARKTTRNTTKRIGALMRDHPLPFSLIGAGIAWIALSSRDGHSAQPGQKQSEYAPPAEAEVLRPGGQERVIGHVEQHDEGFGDKASHGPHGLKQATHAKLSSAQHKGETLKGDMEQRVSNATSSIKQRVAHATEQLHEVSGRGRQRASDVGGAAQSGYRSTRSALLDSIERYPIAMGIVALGAGVVGGMMVPSSSVEQKLLKPSAQPMRERAEKAVDESAMSVAHKAEQVASAAGEEVKKQVGEVKKQGVSHPSVVQDPAQTKRSSPSDSAHPYGI